MIAVNNEIEADDDNVVSSARLAFRSRDLLLASGRCLRFIA